MLQYRPNIVSVKETFEVSGFDDNIHVRSHMVDQRQGTKITARELEVPQEDFNKFFEQYKNFVSLSKEMWQFKAELKSPESLSLMLREIDEVKTFGSLVVDEELPELRVYLAIEKGIKGWYVNGISLHHEVTSKIDQSKILKYGIGSCNFNFSDKSFKVEGHDREDVMGDMEIIFGQVTNSESDPRYSFLAR